MDYLQYCQRKHLKDQVKNVLNLIINGLPSILRMRTTASRCSRSFKPYYKWITFNIVPAYYTKLYIFVLNLIINGLPSI